MASAAMIAATIVSGHPVPVPKTPSAASKTQIAEYIVAGANPRGAHIGITMTIGPKQSERRSIGQQRRNADGAHGECARQRSMQSVPDAPESCSSLKNESELRVHRWMV
jgi:hypothetical protein